MPPASVEDFCRDLGALSDLVHDRDASHLRRAHAPRGRPAGPLTARIDFDFTPPRAGADRQLAARPLINNLNRAVGQHDAYPFVLTPAVIDKLGFIQRIVAEAGAAQWTVPGPNGPIPINAPAP